MRTILVGSGIVLTVILFSSMLIGIGELIEGLEMTCRTADRKNGDAKSVGVTPSPLRSDDEERAENRGLDRGHERWYEADGRCRRFASSEIRQGAPVDRSYQACMTEELIGFTLEVKQAHERRMQAIIDRR